MPLTIHDVAIFARGTVVEHQDITIDNARIQAITPHQSRRPDSETREHDTVVDGRGLLAIPGLKNAQTHSAMTLFRGYGEGFALHEWLQRRIWPAEAKLTEQDVYWGTRLAAMEMVRCGTTYANDMYFFPEAVAAAFRDSGIRAGVGLTLFDFGDAQRRRSQQQALDHTLAAWPDSPQPAADRLRYPVIAPHSVYTCSPELLRWAAARAREHGLLFHIHMAESQREVDDAENELGARPFAHLQRCGALEQVAGRALAAHAVWLDNAELALAHDHAITLVHNPASNAKIASGVLPWRRYVAGGMAVLLATDGAASNNGLNMLHDARLAALLQNVSALNAQEVNHQEILSAAFGGVAGGDSVLAQHGASAAIEPGAAADIALLRLDHYSMVPQHDLGVNLLYSAEAEAVDTVICAGNVLMRGRRLPDEELIIAEVTARARSLAERVAAG